MDTFEKSFMIINKLWREASNHEISLRCGVGRRAAASACVGQCVRICVILQSFPSTILTPQNTLLGKTSYYVGYYMVLIPSVSDKSKLDSL